MIGRRNFLVGGGLFLCAGPSLAQPEKTSLLSAPPGKSLGFRITRDGSPVGTHILTFDQQDGGNLTIQIAVELRVGIGPIALFRYKHRATEVWKDGALFSLDAETNDDGNPCKVSGRRTEAGFMVQGTRASLYAAPEDALPATHWNRKMLDGPMINTQYGTIMHPSITALGSEPIPVASGGQITAQHFNFSGDATLDTWYDSAPSWAGIAFKAGDGSKIRYERI